MVDTLKTMKRPDVKHIFHESMLALTSKLTDRTAKGRNFRLVLLVAGVCVLLFQLNIINKMHNLNTDVPHPPLIAEAAVEVKEMESKIPAIESYAARTRSISQTVALIKNVGRQPFYVTRPVPPTPGMPVLPPSVGGEPQPYEPPAPTITVKGFMILGPQSAVIADIEGEGEGIVMKQGSKFAGGSGVITNITQGELHYKWNGKPHTLSMGDF